MSIMNGKGALSLHCTAGIDQKTTFCQPFSRTEHDYDLGIVTGAVHNRTKQTDPCINFSNSKSVFVLRAGLVNEERSVCAVLSNQNGVR